MFRSIPILTGAFVGLLLGSSDFAIAIQQPSAPPVAPAARTAPTPTLQTASNPASKTPARKRTLALQPMRLFAAQVALDRANFSPGVIDGRKGNNTDRALRGFQAARNLAVTGQLDAQTISALGEPFTNPTATYLISAADVAGPFAPHIPEDMVEKAALPALSYTSVQELLAERFHTSVKMLERLNPGTTFAQGDIIIVPNVELFLPAQTSPTRAGNLRPGTGEDPARAGGTGTTTPDARRAGGAAAPAAQRREPVVVTVTDKTKTLTVQNSAGQTIFQAPVTVGSTHDPLPIGEWKVTGVDRNPKFNYNPDLFWDANPAHSKATLPPGPNNPVGVTWIDLSKEHYGIHGTPEPSRIGYTESHGCIRLTNWDVVRLASLVGPGTKVVLQ